MTSRLCCVYDGVRKKMMLLGVRSYVFLCWQTTTTGPDASQSKSTLALTTDTGTDPRAGSRVKRCRKGAAGILFWELNFHSSLVCCCNWRRRRRRLLQWIVCIYWTIVIGIKVGLCLGRGGTFVWHVIVATLRRWKPRGDNNSSYMVSGQACRKQRVIQNIIIDVSFWTFSVFSDFPAWRTERGNENTFWQILILLKKRS